MTNQSSRTTRRTTSERLIHNHSRWLLLMWELAIVNHDCWLLSPVGTFYRPLLLHSWDWPFSNNIFNHGQSIDSHPSWVHEPFLNIINHHVTINDPSAVIKNPSRTSQQRSNQYLSIVQPWFNHCLPWQPPSLAIIKPWLMVNHAIICRTLSFTVMSQD